VRIGSLCSGYGGLELGVQAVYGGTTAWVSDIDKGACKILAHRFPGVPNVGDMTAVDWAAVEPVDLICGGMALSGQLHRRRSQGPG
jgi:DNA (cytosine-5)-methyltransferase 1